MDTNDYLLNEVRKFALLLAKLMGFKAEGLHDRYRQEFDKVLQNEYNAELETLLNLSNQEFTDVLNKGAYSAEKVNALAQMLYIFAQPLNTSAETTDILQKVLIIFDLLEEKYHFQTFDNITNRNAIYRYFKSTND